MENTVGHPRSWEFICAPTDFFTSSGPLRDDWEISTDKSASRKLPESNASMLVRMLGRFSGPNPPTRQVTVGQGGRMIEVKQGELEQLGALLKKYEIEALIARHKPQALDVRFDVQRLDRNSLAASFPRISTAGPYSITLSPLPVEWGLTDRVSFSTIILHE
jgi:hypothetical protein